MGQRKVGAGDENKLPRWARERIAILRARADRLQETLDSMQGNLSGPVSVRLGGTEQQYALPQHARVRFRFGEDIAQFIEVGMSQYTQGALEVYGGDVVSVTPRSSNTFTVKLGRT